MDSRFCLLANILMWTRHDDARGIVRCAAIPTIRRYTVQSNAGERIIRAQFSNVSSITIIAYENKSAGINLGRIRKGGEISLITASNVFVAGICRKDTRHSVVGCLVRDEKTETRNTNSRSERQYRRRSIIQIIYAIVSPVYIYI